MERPERTEKLQRRREVRSRNTDWFCLLCADLGLKVIRFDYGKHLRAVGIGRLDFWPATGRWWNLESRKSGNNVNELIVNLKTLAGVTLEEEAAQHMKEICSAGRI